MAEKKKLGFDAEEVAIFCEQISLILSSDIPLYEGMEALAGDRQGVCDEAAYAAMCREMEESGSLAAAVERAGVFPVYMVGMVRVGEEAGQLDRVMPALAAHYMREAQIKRTASSAMRYPLTLIAIMSLVIAVLVIRVLPIFSQAFASLAGGMSGTAATLMQVGQHAGIALLIVLLIFFVIVLASVLRMRSGKGEALRARLTALIPAVSRLDRKMTAQKFASVMSMLLSSGFPLEQALELIPSVYGDEANKKRISDASKKLLDGESILTVVEQMQLFDALYLRMIRVGFASGQADAAFEKTAQLLAEEIDDSIGRLISLIEPVLVVVLSALIGAILLSVMMPLAGVLSAMV